MNSKNILNNVGNFISDNVTMNIDLSDYCRDER